MANENKSTFKDKLRAFWAVVKRCAKRVWAYLKVAKMEYIVMLSLFALDLISKAIIDATMTPGDTIVIIPYVLQFHYTHNPNAAFGSGFLKDWFGALGARIFFCVFAVAASVVFILILIRHKGGNKLFRIALAMLVAGAMGNCIDRWALSYVRDFIQFVYFGLTIAGSKTFYVFNIADAELVIGVILVIIYFIFVYKDKSSEKKHAKRAKANAVAASADGANADSVAGGETDNGGENVDGGENLADGSASDAIERNEAETEENGQSSFSSDGQSFADGDCENADVSETSEEECNSEIADAAETSEQDGEAKDDGGGADGK